MDGEESSYFNDAFVEPDSPDCTKGEQSVDLDFEDCKFDGNVTHNPTVWGAPTHEKAQQVAGIPTAHSTQNTAGIGGSLQDHSGFDTSLVPPTVKRVSTMPTELNAKYDGMSINTDDSRTFHDYHAPGALLQPTSTRVPSGGSTTRGGRPVLNSSRDGHTSSRTPRKDRTATGGVLSSTDRIRKPGYGCSTPSTPNSRRFMNRDMNPSLIEGACSQRYASNASFTYEGKNSGASIPSRVLSQQELDDLQLKAESLSMGFPPGDAKHELYRIRRGLFNRSHTS